uniref:ECRG4 augurin n=1 Tax=Panthera leo TaxID=9689 RepID=A0A8C8Y2T5_PANLE
MAASSARLTVLAMTALALLLLLCLGPGGVSGNKLKLMLQKQEAPASPKTKVAVDENKAKEFLNSLKRQKRQLWDRTRPEVQQWYQQFLYMGFDEAVGIPGPWRTGSLQSSTMGMDAWLGKMAQKSSLHNSLQKVGDPIICQVLPRHWITLPLRCRDIS